MCRSDRELNTERTRRKKVGKTMQRARRSVAVGILSALFSAWACCCAVGQVTTAAAVTAAPVSGAIQDCPDCPVLRRIPAGQFMMGAAAGEIVNAAAASGAIEQGTSEIVQPTSDATPQHRVVIARSFAMGRTEVTREQFAAFAQETGFEQDGKDCLLTDLGSDPSLIKQDVYASSQAVRNSNWRYPPWPTGPGQPVTCVNWNDAQAYVAWLSKKSGHHYRLPSEAEWEYAARAGTTGYWYWGDDPTAACQYENMADRAFLRQRLRSGTPDNHFDCDDGFAWNAPVGSFKPNPWGLYDMAGNVSELTQDCWHADYRGAPADGAAWVEGGDCRYRVLRGDNGMLHLASTHLASRSGVPLQQYRSTVGGFRVVRELP